MIALLRVRHAHRDEEAERQHFPRGITRDFVSISLLEIELTQSLIRRRLVPLRPAPRAGAGAGRPPWVAVAARPDDSGPLHGGCAALEGNITCPDSLPGGSRSAR
jgi:hypothetical protein